MRPIFDAHLDLAWNALYFDRDLLRGLDELRAAEEGMTDEPSRRGVTVSLPELRRARVAICLATLLARSGPEIPFQPGFKRTDLDYKTPSAAYAHAMGQLAYYRWLEERGHARILTTAAALTAHWTDWQKRPESAPLGLIITMEGADPITDPAQVRQWWAQGLRAIGPAHYGRSHYAGGTNSDVPLTPAGIELLREMGAAGMILDVTHLCDRSFFEALDHFPGRVLASHHNCRALVPCERQLSDEQIRRLIERQAVIGIALDAWMLIPGWVRGASRPGSLTLEIAVNHIDHVCQIAGDVRHCALGTDLDGGFGSEQTPADLRSYSDLRRLEGMLERRGYRSPDIDALFFGNWLGFFGAVLPPG